MKYKQLNINRTLHENADTINRFTNSTQLSYPRSRITLFIRGNLLFE